MSKRTPRRPRRPAFVVCAVAAATFSGVANAAPTYSILDLGPVVDSLTITGLNVRGQVTYTTVAGGITSAFRSEPNSPFNLDTDALGTLGGFSADVFGINAAGRAVGSSERPDGAVHAYRTMPDTAINLTTDDIGTLGGVASSATTINDRGQVAGYSETADPGVFRAFRTSAGSTLNAAGDDLGTLGAATSRAVAINNRGQVIGESQVTEGGPTRSFRTSPDGVIDPLTSDLGSLGGPRTFARGINRAGQVIGFSNPTGAGGRGPFRAFRTLPDASINPLTDDLGTLGGANSSAQGINDRSEVVGESEVAGGGDPHAFVTLRDGTMLDLNAQLDLSGTNWELISARAINNHGQIVTVGRFDPDGDGPEAPTDRVALLTPAKQTLVAEWKSAAGGAWATASNWDTAIPDAAGHHAKFTGVPIASSALTVGGDRILGRLDFAPLQQAGGGYTFNGSGSLTFRSGLEQATLSATSGHHRISVPVILSESLRADLAANSSLTLVHPLLVPAGMSLVKAGTGGLYTEASVTVEPLAQLHITGGILRAESVESEGSVIVDPAATLSAKQVTATSLTVSAGGTVRLLAGGQGLSRIRFLNIAGETGAWAGSLELGSGVLVLQTTPSDRANRLALTTDQVRHARNSGGTPWSGAGITSDLAALDAAGLTTVGILLNDDGNGSPIYDAFGGQPLDANSILVRAVPAGDLDLNGVIDIADYFRIDRGDGLNLSGYSNGDLDYSGVIGPDDYSLMDRAFLFSHQSGPLSSAMPVSVPEPASLFLAAAAAWRLGSRRRRTVA